jgi:hypothetical protein
MHASIEGNELILRIPLLPAPTRSKSGKTLLVATSGGNVATDATVQGKAVVVGVNAYIEK